MIVVQSLEVPQDEHLLVALTELEHGEADPGELPGLLSLLGRALPAAASHRAQATQILLDRVQPLRLGMPAPGASPHPQLIGRDPVQPEAKRGLAAEPPQPAQGGVECVTGQVLGGCDSQGLAVEVIQDPWIVPLEQDAEGIRIAIPRARDEVEIRRSIPVLSGVGGLARSDSEILHDVHLAALFAVPRKERCRDRAPVAFPLGL